MIPAREYFPPNFHGNVFSLKYLNMMELRFVGEEETPPIIGMTTLQIAEFTVEKIKESLGSFGGGEQKITFFVRSDTFFPPSPDVIEACGKVIFEIILSGITSRGADTISSEGGEIIITKLSAESPPPAKAKFRTPSHVFVIKSGSDYALACKIAREIKNSELARKKVYLVSPETTYISFDSEIGEGVVIQPEAEIISSKIMNRTFVGRGCVISNCKIGSDVSVLPYSFLEGAEIEDGASIGPFARIRSGTIIRKGAKIGNFAELKNSEIGEGSKAQHFSYIGDARVGRNVNIGAGTVTCNYDGVRKFRTEIGDNAFVGSGSMLVAPLKIGEFGYTGAGSTITKDVPSGALAVERAEQKIIPEWGEKKLKEKAKKEEGKNK